MDFEVTPPLEPAEREALRLVFEQAPQLQPDDPYAAAWRLTGFREAAEDESETGYAFSPRSTRGATRA